MTAHDVAHIGVRVLSVVAALIAVALCAREVRALTRAPQKRKRPA